MLAPVLRWESKLVHLKDMVPGASIGYGRTFTTNEPTRIGVVPVGYADGYPLSLSNRASVLVRGKRCPVRGRVSMDQIVVELNNAPNARARRYAHRQRRGEITASELAERGDHLYDSYGIGKRVKREYVERRGWAITTNHGHELNRR